MARNLDMIVKEITGSYKTLNNEDYVLSLKCSLLVRLGNLCLNLYFRKLHIPSLALIQWDVHAL